MLLRSTVFALIAGCSAFAPSSLSRHAVTTLSMSDEAGMENRRSFVTKVRLISAMAIDGLKMDCIQ
jgi:hypothetical protein